MGRLSIIVEYYAGPVDVLISNKEEFLRGLLKDAGLEFTSLDLGLLRDAEKLAFLQDHTTHDLVCSDGVCWVIAGKFERCEDLAEYIEDLGVGFFEKLISSGPSYMVSYVIIPVNDGGVERVHEIVDRIHRIVSSRLGVAATIKLRVYGRLKKIPEKASVYSMDGYYVVVVYDPHDLKAVLELLTP